MLTSASGYLSRYTDRETLEIFEMVYSGVANKRIVEKLQKLGVNAIGLSGIDGRIWEGRRKPFVKIVENDKVKLIRDDFTGTVDKVNVRLLNLLLDNGYTPVLTPPAISYESEAINVDNDRAIAVLANEMQAECIVILFEAAGLLKDPDDPSSLIKRIDKAKVSDFMQYAEGRMKKKILGTVEAFGKSLGENNKTGINKIVYGDARIKQPITSALAGNGTVIE
jgi:acetylglutamate/LysW-gamma-L-alpha-aminoadipate kinase